MLYPNMAIFLEKLHREWEFKTQAAVAEYKTQLNQHK